MPIHISRGGAGWSFPASSQSSTPGIYSWLRSLAEVEKRSPDNKCLCFNSQQLDFRFLFKNLLRGIFVQANGIKYPLTNGISLGYLDKIKERKTRVFCRLVSRTLYVYQPDDNFQDSTECLLMN